ncbi:MAG: recombinase family protein [Cyclobacteriaceae bacterium]
MKIRLKDGIDISTATGRFIFNIFASLAEFEGELEIFRERTMAGLEAAKSRGKKKWPTPRAQQRSAGHSRTRQNSL